MANQQDLNEAQGPGEMAQWMRALAILPEYWSLVMYTHTVGLTTTCKFSSRGSDNLFWSPLVPHPLQWSLCDKSKSLATVLRQKVSWKLISWSLCCPITRMWSRYVLAIVVEGFGMLSFSIILL